MAYERCIKQTSLRQFLIWKTHRQVSKKRGFEKYCSCDRPCQFSALQGTPRRSYQEKMIFDDKRIDKRGRLFIQQTMCL